MKMSKRQSDKSIYPFSGGLGSGQAIMGLLFKTQTGPRNCSSQPDPAYKHPYLETHIFEEERTRKHGE